MFNDKFFRSTNMLLCLKIKNCVLTGILFHQGGTEEMSSTKKMLLILDMFTHDKVTISLEEVIQLLNISVPTGYRYLKELCDVGLLAKSESNSYILGPKIIKLDYQIRTTDPVIKLGKPILKELMHLTGGEVLLSTIYNDEIINIYSERSSEFKYELTYSRGNPHPIFKGATSKIITAYLPKNKLKNLFEKNRQKILSEIPNFNFEQFQEELATYKKQGYVISHGQLDENFVGVAAPIFVNNQIQGAITLVLPSHRLAVYNQESLVQFVTLSSTKLTQQLHNNFTNQ